MSFLSGKVVYVSPQGSSLLRCKPECLQGTVFSELLAPQDVSTFYSGTAPCRLPHWASCIGSGELKSAFWKLIQSLSLPFLTLLRPCSVPSCRLHSGEVDVLPDQRGPDAGRRDALLPLSPYTVPADHQRLGRRRATALLLAHRRTSPLWI